MTEPTADKLLCPRCGALAVLKDSVVIYKRSYGLVYICPNFPACDCYVGVHEGTTKPKGTLADLPLRTARKKAHAAFDVLWKPHGGRPGRMKRNNAYARMARHFGLSEIHIGWSDATMCAAIEAWALAQTTPAKESHA